LKTYCVFCKTGSESLVAEKINIVDKKVKAIAPMRVIQEKRNGKWEKKEKALLPGYVFIFTEEELNTFLLNRLSDLYKVLSYDTGVRELAGNDYQYALWVWRHEGSINSSKVLTEGKNVRVVDGPLLDSCGKIVKLDKHKRKVWVEFEFEGVTRTIVLSAECITEQGRNNEQTN